MTEAFSYTHTHFFFLFTGVCVRVYREVFNHQTLSLFESCSLDLLIHRCLDVGVRIKALAFSTTCRSLDYGVDLKS